MQTKGLKRQDIEIANRKRKGLKRQDIGLTNRCPGKCEADRSPIAARMFPSARSITCRSTRQDHSTQHQAAGQLPNTSEVYGMLDAASSCEPFRCPIAFRN
jgi:hypothetical protein